LLSDYRFDQLVTLVAKEIILNDELGLRWSLRLPDYTLVHPAAEKPLDEGARALLDFGFNPSAVLRIVSWFTATSYRSCGHTALRGVLADIVGRPELVANGTRAISMR
jgi:hypothetical protein